MIMTKKNMFDDVLNKGQVNNELPAKKNPHMNLESIQEKPKYRSVRIHPDTYDFFREYAHQRRITVIEAITMAKDLLEKHDPLD